MSDYNKLGFFFREVTGGQSGSHIEQELSSLRDISGSRVVVSAPAANTDESLMEFSTYATPRGSPNSEHFNNLDKMNTSAPLVEERFITFEDLVPPATSKRLDAARMFSALLSNTLYLLLIAFTTIWWF